MASFYFYSQQIQRHTYIHTFIHIDTYKRDSDFSKLFFYHVFKWSNASLLSHMRMLRRAATNLREISNSIKRKKQERDLYSYRNYITNNVNIKLIIFRLIYSNLTRVFPERNRKYRKSYNFSIVLYYYKILLSKTTKFLKAVFDIFSQILSNANSDIWENEYSSIII